MSKAFDRVPARAWLVLGAALVSALVLAAVGLFSYGSLGADPALAGQATLARLAGGVADGVVAEWERVRRDQAVCAGPKRLVWSAEPPPAARAALELPSVEDRVLDALLSEATRLEHDEHDPVRALAIVVDAARRPADPQRRAELALRTIQLARATHDDALARKTWQQAWPEIDPGLARNGTSVLLLATLAAGPTPELVERAGARDRLAQLWSRGELALPLESPPAASPELAAALAEPAPLCAELRRRLQELVPEAALDERLERTRLVDRARALAAVFGALPAPLDGDLARLASTATHELLYRRASSSECEGVLLARDATRARLEASLAGHELLPPDFTLDFTGTDAARGPIVRAATELPGSPLAFVLRHADPERILSAVGQRQAWIRGALFVLALFTAAAGASTFRAIVRERRLAALKSAFVANVSHELRTPIASILLLAENLERGRVADDDARRRYHGLIRREAERLRGLVEDVLDMARLERGEALSWNKATLATTELANALELAARERVAAAEGTLEFTTRALPERVEVDAEALRRALLNLVENALLHSGSSALDLALEGDGAGGIVLRLRDHGRGVPSPERERIFEPFARLEHADAAPGTGLGLAIVREVALGHGGRASVRAPESGPGAVFELHLPAGGGAA
ncbi:MAG: HAMP domain-containing histidine kinase [Planctomycetes bacterium]|nr:HAMP domain-containing histidine kinase [Planctomycetota bacterium]